MAVAKKKTEVQSFSLKELMKELRDLGTEQNVKIYRRHGAIDPLFGVSFANLKILAKKIKTNQALAVELWTTGNYDAMNLAGMIADPSAFDDVEADRWLESVKSYPIALAIAGIIANSPCALSRVKAWTRSTDEYTRACGYDTLAQVLRDGRLADDRFLKGLLERIEREIHSSANRARNSMNSAVIGIGGYRPGLREIAIATAKRIGKVEVDHGETDCKTPDAVSYIEKMASRAK